MLKYENIHPHNFVVNSCFSVDRIVTKSNKNLNDSSNDRENVAKHIDKSVQTKSHKIWCLLSHYGMLKPVTISLILMGRS